MQIKPLKNLTKDDFYFGLSTDDLIGTIFSIFVLRHLILTSEYTFFLLIIALVTLISVSFLRLNYRRKIIRDSLRFVFNFLFKPTVKV